MNWRPLDGVIVVDLTRMLPGGSATLLLADLGARIIKVERPGDLDATRYLAPRVGTDSSVQHQYLDRDKETIQLDLRSESGHAELLELVQTADAIVDSFRPGVMDRLGLSSDVLLGANPGLVALSLSGYGAGSVMSSYAGHDLNFVARAGVLGAGTEVPPLPIADLSGGMLAATAIVAGVLQARASGHGSVIDLGLADAALFVAGSKRSPRSSERRLLARASRPRSTAPVPAMRCTPPPTEGAWPLARSSRSSGSRPSTS